MSSYIFRPTHWVPGIALAGLLLLVAAAPLQAAGPPPPGGPDKKDSGPAAGQRPAAPAAYALQGDTVNISSASTKFTATTESSGVGGGWVFTDDATSGTTLVASCLNGTNCWGIKSTGTSRGVYGVATTPNGAAVYGSTNGSTSTGVYGTTSGTNGVGVYGVTTGAGSESAGVKGEGSSRGGVFTGTNATSIGVQASGHTGVQSVGETGGYFLGNVGVVATGDISGITANSSSVGIYAQGDLTGISATSSATGTGIYIGTSNIGIDANAANIAVKATSSVTGTGIYVGTSDTGVDANATNIAVKATSAQNYAVSGTSTQAAGVYGTTNSTGNSTAVLQDSGVFGVADMPPGVRGETAGTSVGIQDITAGVVGHNALLHGGSATNNAGVYGSCDDCRGVWGSSNTDNGVYGYSTGTIVNNYHVGAGLYGDSSDTYGLYAHSTNWFGVYGVSDNSYGFVGSAPKSIAIRATSKDGAYGLWASNSSGWGGRIETVTGTFGLKVINKTVDSTHWAISAEGNVTVTGKLHADGGIVAPVATSQGTRETYSDQSTIHIMSDQGTATLKNGRAVIMIDPLYAQTVNLPAGYQVFVTPNSADTLGLAVINETATSFEVRELGKGTSSFRFHWRISAPRKGYEKDRLAPVPVTPFEKLEDDSALFASPPTSGKNK